MTLTSQTPCKGLRNPQGHVDHTLRTAGLDKNTDKIWSQAVYSLENNIGDRVTRPWCDPGSAIV